MDQKISAICCDDCAPRPLTRNHYFTGKLLVERDFTDEQRFFLEKFRLHLQRLHGTGVVCGLRLTQHPNSNCRDRLVILEPGSAIDCCGHDVFVLDQEVFDFSTAPEVKALKDKPDGKDHILEFCLSYRECPTEEIPVLYDDCGCDDTQCAPNRILESFEIKVHVDPPPQPPKFAHPKLSWIAPFPIAHAAIVALDENKRRLYVLTNSGNATLHQVSTDNLLVEASFALNRRAFDLAVTPDGSKLYVAVTSVANNPTDPRELLVFTPDGTGGIGSGPQNSATAQVKDSSGTALALSMLSDGGLLAVGTYTGNLWLWPPGATDAGAPSVAVVASPSVKRTRAAIASSGKFAYVGRPGSSDIEVIDLTTLKLLPTLTITPIASVDAVAVSASAASDKLAVLENGAAKLHLVDPAGPGSLVGSVALDRPPTALAVTLGGQWAVVAVADGTTTDLQVVNLAAIAQTQPTPLFPIGEGGGAPVLASSGRIYVPFIGDPNVADSGAVAVIDVSEVDCRALLQGGDCPSCDAPDCLVLARVSHYQPGYKIEDLPTPKPAQPPDPKTKIAWIDNHDGRIVLPSTQAIAQALACAMDRAAGPAQGPLTHIAAISWTHTGNVTLQTLLNSGLGIDFDQGGVKTGDLNDQTVMLMAPHGDSTTSTTCWCQIPVKQMTFVNPKNALCTGIHLTFEPNALHAIPQHQLNNNAPIYLRVIVKGDLIRDQNDRALDANNLPPWIKPGKPSGDGVEGGTFESWFRLM